MILFRNDLVKVRTMDGQSGNYKISLFVCDHKDEFCCVYIRVRILITLVASSVEVFRGIYPSSSLSGFPAPLPHGV